MFNKDKIKELYPGAEDYLFEPMLIHASTDAQLKAICASDDYFGQLKKDGALYMFVKTEKGSYLFGRTVSKITGLLTEKGANVPHIMNALEKVPDGTVIIGEIYYPGGSSKNTTPIMGCLPQKAIDRQYREGYGLIHYYIHDMVFLSGNDMRKIGALKRYKALAELYDILNLQRYKFLELAEIWEDDLYNRISRALEDGEEGMVLKYKDGAYEPGKRPMTNWKAKKVDTLDVIITGFEAPTYEYTGKELDSWTYYIDGVPVTKAAYYHWDNSRIQIGAYYNGVLTPIGTISSGISDSMKEDMSIHPDNYLGQVCKIQCMEKDNKEHTLRHGFFLELRDDKQPSDCTFENIFI